MSKARKRNGIIDRFKLTEGDVLAGKYEIIGKLGSGWESEVFLIREIATGIERAAKLFFPHRNHRNRTAKLHAQKLHALRHCAILIQYVTQEVITYHQHTVTLLISEFVDGELLGEFVKKQPGNRMAPFEALHLLYALADGLADIHNAREYHGDLHLDNIILNRHGIEFDVKVIDFFHRDASKRENIQDDVCDLIRIFYDVLGGAPRYPKHHPQIKSICCGLKRSLILKKFRTAARLRDYLETMAWD